MIKKSNRYTDTLWCVCNNYEEYCTFVKQMWKWNDSDSTFGGETFEYKSPWFESTGEWMDAFGIPWVKEDPNDKYSDEHEIKDPLTDTYEITEKPEDDEYPVVVHVKKLVGKVEVDWFSISMLHKKCEKEYSKSTLMRMTKKELIDYIRMLVSNNNRLHETIDNQCENFKKLCKDCYFNFLYEQQESIGLEGLNPDIIAKDRIRQILWNLKLSSDDKIAEIRKLINE